MKITLSINIFLCTLLFGCNSKTGKVSEHDGAVIRDSKNQEIEKTEIEEQIKENFKSVAESFYPVYVKDAIMIFDSVEIGQICYLIDLHGQSIIKTQTSKHKVFWTEVFEKKVTITEASDTTKYQLAFLGDTAKIEWIEKKIMNDTQLKENILCDFNISNYGGLFENYGGPISIYTGKILENPEVETISFGTETLYLVTYKLESYPDYIVNGPSFLISTSNRNVYPLTGPCSRSDSNIFILNGKLYIHTGSNCCDCGIVVEQLYEYNGSKIEQIIEDGSWST